MKHICFIFLLFDIVKSAAYDPNLTLVFQTFSSQQTGYSRSSFVADHIGPNIDYNFNILNNESNPINFGNPFWLYQIDNNFHFLSFRFSNIIKTQEVIIYPLSSYLTNLNLFQLNLINFTIQNLFTNETLIIREVTSFSKEIFTFVQNDTAIEPQSQKVFTACLCPHRYGLFSTVILISTNKGSIVYPITYKSLPIPNQHSISTHFSISSLMPYNVTVDSHSIFKSNQLSVFYDASFLIFDRMTTTNQFKFQIPKLLPGYYVSFLNLVSLKAIRIIPLFFTVTPKLLQSFDSLILFKTITKIDEKQEIEIKVTNPTILTIQILSVHLESDSIPNLKIVHVKPPLDCDPQSVKVIGKLQMTGSKLGEINTNVIVLYDAGNMMVQTLEIPVKGYVSIGSFYSVKTIELVGKDAQYVFNLTNRFTEYILIITAYIESEDFYVQPFSPFILTPNNTTRNINISFSSHMTNHTDKDIIKSTLYIETNITMYSVPIIGYLGVLSISKDLSTIGLDNQINFTFNDVFYNSEKRISFFIANPNPISFNSTLKSQDSLVEIISSNKIYIPKFSSIKYSYKVKFHDPAKLGLNFQNSTFYSILYFPSCNQNFEIVLNWTGMPGEFILKSNRYKIVFGLKHNISVRLKSNYRVPMNIHHIECPINGNMVNNNLQINPDNEYEIYSLEFAFDSAFLSKFNQKFNYSELTFDLPIEFTFYLQNKFIIKSNLTIRFEFAEFPTKTYESALVPINSLMKANFSVKNFFDVPVEFEALHPKCHTIHFQTHRSQIIQPGQLYNLNLLYRPKLVGHNNFSIMVKTNATKSPFSMNIWYEGVNPSFSVVRLTNKVEEIIDHLQFSIHQPNQIEDQIFMKNDGNVTIPIEKFDFSPQINYKTKCQSTLPINEKCEISLFIHPQNLMHRHNNLLLKLTSCAIVKTINVSVSIDEKTIWHLRISHFLTFIGVVLLAILPFFIEYLSYEYHKANLQFEFDWRSEAIEREIERLSVSKRSSISIQTCTFERKPFVGRWQPPDIYKATPASATGIDAMTKIIDVLK